MLGGIRSGYIQRLCRTMGTRVGRDINFMDSRKQCGVIGKIMPSSKGHPILQFLQHSRDPPPQITPSVVSASRHRAFTNGQSLLRPSNALSSLFRGQQDLHFSGSVSREEDGMTCDLSGLSDEVPSCLVK